MSKYLCLVIYILILIWIIFSPVWKKKITLSILFFHLWKKLKKVFLWGLFFFFLKGGKKKKKDSPEFFSTHGLANELKQLTELGKLNWLAKKQNKSFYKHINCWGFIFFFCGGDLLTTELVYHSTFCNECQWMYVQPQHTNTVPFSPWSSFTN